MRKLTDPQRRALAFLASRDSAMPAEIGYALTADQRWPLKPQGAGRLGGSMGTRLQKMGLTRAVNRLIGGSLWPAGYAITQAGRKALEE